jgi:hypothetical protein
VAVAGPSGADEAGIVARFATALDADDFAAVESMLDPSCRYAIGAAVHHGPAPVVASYRQGSTEGRRLFDTVSFTHRPPRPLGPHRFSVEFIDELRHRGELLVHRSVQEVALGDDHRVVEIRDVTDPGEAAKVADFLARHGLVRRSGT